MTSNSTFVLLHHQHMFATALMWSDRLNFVHFLQMLCMLLLEPGDGVLMEQYSYSHLVEHTLKLRGNHAVPVAMDALGVQPAALRSVLQVCAVAGSVDALAA